MKIMLVGGPRGGEVIDVDKPGKFYRVPLMEPCELTMPADRLEATKITTTLYRMEMVGARGPKEKYDIPIYFHHETLPNIREALVELVNGYGGARS